mmetsp:Transcript_42087/g.120795  ORF Transcript_42087/g.120795 Transcript_42087/m.120795 type:complete len:394 (+) Transcript_42087:835-2016(+)
MRAGALVLHRRPRRPALRHGGVGAYVGHLGVPPHQEVVRAVLGVETGDLRGNVGAPCGGMVPALGAGAEDAIDGARFGPGLAAGHLAALAVPLPAVAGQEGGRLLVLRRRAGAEVAAAAAEPAAAASPRALRVRGEARQLPQPHLRLAELVPYGVGVGGEPQAGGDAPLRGAELLRAAGVDRPGLLHGPVQVGQEALPRGPLGVLRPLRAEDGGPRALLRRVVLPAAVLGALRGLAHLHLRWRDLRGGLRRAAPRIPRRAGGRGGVERHLRLAGAGADGHGQVALGEQPALHVVHVPALLQRELIVAVLDVELVEEVPLVVRLSKARNRDAKYLLARRRELPQSHELGLSLDLPSRKGRLAAEGGAAHVAANAAEAAVPLRHLDGVLHAVRRA